MPQNAQQVLVGLNDGAPAPIDLDDNNQVVLSPDSNINTRQGNSSALNTIADAVIKATPGRLIRVTVLVAGAVGAIHDCAAVADAAAGNKVAVIPAVVGVYYFDWPCLVGIVYKVGASQVISVSFE